MLEQLQSLTVKGLLKLPKPVMRRLAGPPIELDGQKLDLQTQFLLRLQKLAGIPPMNELSVEEARALYYKITPLGRSPSVAAVRDRSIPGDPHDIPLRIYTPHRDYRPLPVIVYYHGGGWVIGDLDTHDGPCRQLANTAGATVVSVDYRLAPEHKFPVAAEDALTAWRWVTENLSEIKGDRDRIAVVGDSAGGQLSAVVCQRAKRQGLPLPKFQLLFYPATDLSKEYESQRTFGEGFPLTTPLVHWFTNHYLGSPEDAKDDRASPLLAESLEGLPPALVRTAGFDPLRDEGKAYAERLREAGVPVEYRNDPSLTHGWISMTGVIDEAARSFDATAEALRKALC